MALYLMLLLLLMMVRHSLVVLQLLMVVVERGALGAAGATAGSPVHSGGIEFAVHLGGWLGFAVRFATAGAAGQGSSLGQLDAFRCGSAWNQSFPSTSSLVVAGRVQDFRCHRVVQSREMSDRLWLVLQRLSSGQWGPVCVPS